MQFMIDAGFDALCFRLGRLQLCHVLLMNNAEIPWFILIPETAETELCDLPERTQTQLFAEINAMSLFVRESFSVDKLNIACNGNLIRQMHWHVIGRRFDDYCWPDVVWGKNAPSVYEEAERDNIKSMLINDAALALRGYRSD